MSELKPFHESIINIIDSCFEEDLHLLANIIQSTKIPANHDAIITAWRKKAEEFSFLDYDVAKSILEQKRECQKNFFLYTRFGELMDAGEVSKEFWHKIGSKFSNVNEIVLATNGWKDLNEIKILEDYTEEGMFKELVNLLKKVDIS